MKKIITYCILSITLGVSFSSCGSDKSNTSVTITQHAADGLNLKAVTDLAGKAKSAEDFEKKLNETGNKINNLDLDEDGKVDYIKVTEINKGKQKGFSLTTELQGDTGLEEQELATIQFEKDTSSNKTNVQTHGNSHIYGHNHYYHRSFLGDMLMWHYLTSSHRPYYSSYGRNRYPSHFSSRAPVSNAQYSGFHKSQPYAASTTKSTTSKSRAPLISPNKGKTASSIKAPLKNPTTSQKSFQKRNPSKSVTRSRSFGSSSSSSRYGSSSSSRSRSSFGGGK